MTNTRYLLDANIFIDASRRYYQVGICPDFWPMLIEQHKLGRVLSIDRVRQEVLKHKQDEKDDNQHLDVLAKWVKNKAPKSMFPKCDDLHVLDSYKEIMQSVYAEPQYFDTAKKEFAAVADSWLVAYAHANDMTVVTHENASPNSKKRVLIPAVCKDFKVPVVNLFDMLRDLQIQFVRKL